MPPHLPSSRVRKAVAFPIHFHFQLDSKIRRPIRRARLAIMEAIHCESDYGLRQQCNPARARLSPRKVCHSHRYRKFLLPMRALK